MSRPTPQNIKIGDKVYYKPCRPIQGEVVNVFEHGFVVRCPSGYIQIVLWKEAEEYNLKVPVDRM